MFGKFAKNVCLPPEPLVDTLGRVSYSVALNSGSSSQVSGTAGQSSGTAQQATLTSAANSFSVSSVTAKFVILQPKATFANFTDALKTLDSQKQKDFLDSGARLIQASDKLTAYEDGAGSTYDQWQSQTAQQLSSLTSDQIVSAWLRTGDQLIKVYQTVTSWQTDAVDSGHRAVGTELCGSVRRVCGSRAHLLQRAASSQAHPLF